MNEFIANFILISGITGLIICLLAVFSPKRLVGVSARWRYYLWMVLAIRLILPIDISLPERAAKLPVWKLEYQQAPGSAGDSHPGLPGGAETLSMADIPSGVPSAWNDLPTFAGAPANAESPASHGQGQGLSGSQPLTANPARPFSDILKQPEMAVLILWLSGLAISAVWHGLQYQVGMARMKRFSLKADSALLKMAGHMAKSMGIHKEVRVYRCPCIDTPMAAGFRQTGLYLPVRDYSERELEFIFRHECIHIKRRDLWYQLAMLTVKVVHWFNPAVYLMAQKAREDMELVCDELVTENMGREQRLLYNQVLLAAVEGKPVTKLFLSTQFNGSFQSLKLRVVRIMGGKPRKKGVWLAALFGTVLFVSSLFIACDSKPDQNRTDTTSIGVTKSIAPPDDKEQPVSNHAETPQPQTEGILLAQEGRIQYYLRRWTEADSKKQEYVDGGSNYPIQWLGKIVKVVNGEETVLDELVDYDAVTGGSYTLAGDRIVFQGYSGYDAMGMKAVTYVSIDKDGKDRLLYSGDYTMTSQVFYDKGKLYFESFDGQTDDNNYPRLVVEMTPEFAQAKEVLLIEGLLIVVQEGKAYYLGNDTAKAGIYRVPLEPGAKPELRSKSPWFCSKDYLSEISNVRVVTDMANQTRYEYLFQQELGGETVSMQLSVHKEYDESQLSVFSGPALTEDGYTYVFAEDSGGQFGRYEPVRVTLPYGYEVRTGEHIEVHYESTILETYPVQVSALIASSYGMPASQRLPEQMTQKEAGLKYGCYVSMDGEPVYNEEQLDAFIAAASTDRMPAFLRIASYTSGEENAPYIRDIYFDGSGFVVMEDGTRAVDMKQPMDAQQGLAWLRRAGYQEQIRDNPVISELYTSESLEKLGGMVYLEREFSSINVFDDGTVILSKEAGLTKDKFWQRFYSSNVEDALDCVILK